MFALLTLLIHFLFLFPTAFGLLVAHFSTLAKLLVLAHHLLNICASFLSGGVEIPTLHVPSATTPPVSIAVNTGSKVDGNVKNY